MTIPAITPAISKGVRRLRIGLAVLVVVLVLGQVANFLTYYSHHDSFSDYWSIWGRSYRRTEPQVVQLLLLLTITYTTKRHLWGIGALVLACKLAGLVWFYSSINYEILSVLYYEEYFGAFSTLGLYWPGYILFMHTVVGFTILTLLYLFSIWVCWTQMRRPLAVELAV